jgi:hypothetical protein
MMENVCHGTLEDGSNIFETKWHDVICESALGCGE